MGRSSGTIFLSQRGQPRLCFEEKSADHVYVNRDISCVSGRRFDAVRSCSLSTTIHIAGNL